MPLAKNLIEAAGNATQANYIEDCFSSYLYTGNSSTQNIVNGIDLAGKGGLVWGKNRLTGYYHLLTDSNRGVTKQLYTSETWAEGTDSTLITSLNSTGFTLGSGSGLNQSGNSYASWTFRKQPKFFDVVTYTGNGTSQNITHSLGSVPGCIVVKATSGVSNWFVYHRSLGNANLVYLNATSASASTTIWNSTDPTSTQFSINGTSGNASGVTYVAYIFAHDAGGFGISGTDNVISCGSYVGNGSATGPVVTLGWEPQWILWKDVTDSVQDWCIQDSMRGLGVDASMGSYLKANTSGAENAGGYLKITPTGFQVNSTFAQANASGRTYIYVAIRRGPMRAPTDATKVFAPLALNNTTGTVNTTNFPVDMQIQKDRTFGLSAQLIDRLRGISTTSSTGGARLFTAETSAEGSTSIGTNFNNTGFSTGAGWDSMPTVYWNFRRAPSFFDEVCYTGTGTGTSQTHNLGVIPELKIIKSRSGAVDWVVGGSIISGVGGTANSMILNSTAAVSVNSTYWAAADTSTTFSVRTGNGMSDGSGSTYVAYLFATCPGVSKVGSYTGTGTTKQIDCGFAAGARFVLIKRTDSTGDWYVWDTARGIVSGNDPYLLLNSTAAEVTSTDYIDPYSAGFEISSTAPAAINASGGTYIYLAIA